jgi:arginase
VTSTPRVSATITRRIRGGITGRGQADLTGLEAHTPYVRDGDAVLLGIRENDEHADEVRAVGIPVWAAREIIPNS